MRQANIKIYFQLNPNNMFILHTNMKSIPGIFHIPLLYLLKTKIKKFKATDITRLGPYGVLKETKLLSKMHYLLLLWNRVECRLSETIDCLTVLETIPFFGVFKILTFVVFGIFNPLDCYYDII